MGEEETPQRRYGVTSGAPWWATLLGTIGLPGFLVLFLLGAIPGMSSPSERATERSVAALERAVERVSADHTEITRVLWRLVAVQRTTCLGVWKGNEIMQAQCNGYPSETTRALESASPH